MCVCWERELTAILGYPVCSLKATWFTKSSLSVAFFTVPGCLLCRHCLILTELKLSQLSFPHHSRQRWRNEVDFVTGCVIKGFIVFSAKWITSMLVTACQIKVGSENSTYCVPKSSAGGCKCKGLPFSREYGEELVERRKPQEKKKKTYHQCNVLESQQFH